MDSGSIDAGERLSADLRCDVVVVGAGIAGLSTAYELARLGGSVVVLDRGALGGGMTARTTAHLASELDDFYHELINVRGLDEARLYFQSQAAAIDRIEEIQATEGIDCDFRRLEGFLIPANEDGLKILEREIEACHQVGFHGVGWVDRAAAGGRQPPPWLGFPDQARFHPLKYLGGLARCIRRDGGRLYSDTAVVKVEEASGEVRVTTEGGQVLHAGAAVVATNSPINDHLAIHTKQAPYRTYVIAGRVPRGSMVDALYWDTYDPYHYVRLQEADDGTDWLIVAARTTRRRTISNTMSASPASPIGRAGTTRHSAKSKYRWSGQVYEPSDYAALRAGTPGTKMSMW
jgi:glycine/D-amino acid oxidase-like deaminating enzyme